MATSEQEVRRLYGDMLIPLGIIYSKFINDGRGPAHTNSIKRTPDNPQDRQFSEIPLVFGQIPGGQPGIFLGDMVSEKMLYGSYEVDRTAVVINVTRVNQIDGAINRSGVALLLAHELGHAFRWYMGHVGGQSGYTNEIWARTLELAYVEAIRDNATHRNHLGVNFSDTRTFIMNHRKSLYKNSEGEKQLYTDLTGDNNWVTAQAPKSNCPYDNPNCHHPKSHPMFHTQCQNV